MEDGLLDVFSLPFKILVGLTAVFGILLVFLTGVTITTNQNAKTSASRLASSIRDYGRDNAGFQGARSSHSGQITTFSEELKETVTKCNFKAPVEIRIEFSSGGYNTVSNGVILDTIVNPAEGDLSGIDSLNAIRLNKGDTINVSVTPYYRYYTWQNNPNKWFKGQPIKTNGTVAAYIKVS